MEQTKRLRHRMVITTSTMLPDCQRHYRQIEIGDAEKLGGLMFDSYRGTIDDEGETPEQAIGAIKNTLSGKYGDWIGRASFLIEENGEIQSATIVSFFNGSPLLTFALTHPRAQRKGLASFLIKRSIDALAQASYKNLYLVVTDGNPAERIYSKIGFKRI